MKATKREIEEARVEREYWQRIIDWLGEGWRLYGWNRTESAAFQGPNGGLHEVGGALAARLAAGAAAGPEERQDIYVVKQQPTPGKVWREFCVTTDLAEARGAKVGRRRAYITTWRNGRVVSVEEPPAS